MTFNKYSDHSRPLHVQTNEYEPFVIGADVITYLTGINHPMIMVDRIINYNSNPLSLIAERYISANEPAFVGHFPNLRLWPGIYTLEGLRQSCYLLQILHKLEEADLLKNLLELHNRQILRPQINHELCNNVIDYLKWCKMTDPDLFSIRIKLLEPVFAGSLVRYHCLKKSNDPHCFSVNAVVNERVIAEGEIIQPFIAGS